MSQAAAPQTLFFGPFCLDLVAGRLVRDGQTVELAPRPWALLACLASRPGVLVSKDELLDAVWGHQFVSESSLKVAVNTLRAALGDDSSAPQWVHTVPRRGYRFSDAVRADARTVATAPDPANAPAGAASAPARNHEAVTASRPPVQQPRHNLPAQRVQLLGREAERERILQTLGPHRLVTLVGPGGVGKTSLALAVAAQDAPPDGTWLVRLETLTEPSGLYAAVAGAMGLPDGAGRDLPSLARALAPLRARLVLDNAEHLVDAVAAAVSACLATAPALQVLVTSQRALQLSSEQVLPVAPLPCPPDSERSTAVGSHAAVQLLIERVRAQKPDWEPDEAQWLAAADIARAVEGMPLALELAAARVPMLGLAGVRDRLDQRFKLLTRGASDAPARHRTLQSALEWTVSLLGAEAARALPHLAVFAGHFSLEAAQSLLLALHPQLDEWEALDALQQLRDFGLLVSAEGFHAGVPRVRMYESVRLFAAAQLDAQGQREATETALREQLLERQNSRMAVSELHGSDAWVSPLLPDAADLRASMQAGLSRLHAHFDAVLFKQVLALGSASALFCHRAGLRHSAGQWLDALEALREREQLVLSLDDESHFDQYALLLCAFSQVHPLPKGLAAAERLMRMAEAGRPASPNLFYLHCVASLAHRVANWPLCDRALAQELRLMPAQPSAYQRRYPQWLRVMRARTEGDPVPSEAHWRTQLAESIALGDSVESWSAAMGVAQSLYVRGQSEEAIAVLDRAVDEIRASGRLRSQGQVVAQAIALRLTRDASADTLLRLDEALQVLRSDGMVWWLADALAWVPLWHGELLLARRVQAWSDALVAQRGEVRGPVFTRIRAAWAERAGEPVRDATEALDEEQVLAAVRSFSSREAT